MWKFLRHPNVLPLIGVTMSETRFAMISDWMLNGNISDFVKAHMDVDRYGIVGFHSKTRCPRLIDNLTTPQLVGVAKGLIYIHNEGMIHGDLKGVCLGYSGSCFCLADLNICQGEHTDRPYRQCSSSRLRSTHDCFGSHECSILNLTRSGWHNSMDGTGDPRPGKVQFEGQSPDEIFGLLCSRYGDIRNCQREATIP